MEIFHYLIYLLFIRFFRGCLCHYLVHFHQALGPQIYFIKYISLRSDIVEFVRSKQRTAGADTLLAIDADNVQPLAVDRAQARGVLGRHALGLVLRYHWLTLAYNRRIKLRRRCLRSAFGCRRLGQLVLISLRHFNHTHILWVFCCFSSSRDWRPDFWQKMNFIRIERFWIITYSSSSGVKKDSWPVLSSTICWRHAVQ